MHMVIILYIIPSVYPFWAENGRGHHGGAIWFLGYKPNQKVGSLGIPLYLLGQPLSRNRVFQNFSGEPPPPPPPP